MSQNKELKPNTPYSSSEEETDNEEQTSGSEADQTSGSESDKDLSNKNNVPDSDSESESESESDPSPKKPVNVVNNVKTTPLVNKMISTLSPAKNKRPPPPLHEKDSKKPKPGKKPEDPDLNLPDSEESESGSESGSDQDSDLPPKKPLNVADGNTKPKPRPGPGPNASKVVDNKVVKKDGAKTTSTPKRQQPTSVLKTGSKVKEVKKETNGGVTEDDTKKLFLRVWSEGDEIAILEGMIRYKSEKNGEDPGANMGAFHEFVKESLHAGFSRSQLVDKVRRLKNKYTNNAGKGKDGKSFTKKHEQKAYELSKLIWGSGTEGKKKQSLKSEKSKGVGSESGGSLVKTNGVDDKQKLKMEVETKAEVETKTEVETKMDVSRFVLYGGRNDSMFLNEEIVKAGMELVDGPRRAEIEEKWRKLREQELVLYVKRMELLREQALIVLEAIGSSGN